MNEQAEVEEMFHPNHLNWKVHLVVVQDTVFYHLGAVAKQEAVEEGVESLMSLILPQGDKGLGKVAGKNQGGLHPILGLHLIHH